MQSTKDSANAAMEKACDAANTTGQEREENKQEAAGFLQQVY